MMGRFTNSERANENAPTASRESVSKAVAGTHMRLHGLYVLPHWRGGRLRSVVSRGLDRQTAQDAQFAFAVALPSCQPRSL